MEYASAGKLELYQSTPGRLPRYGDSLPTENLDVLERLSPAVAANRFGLGARPGELVQIGSQPREWLHAQLAGSAPLLMDSELRNSADILARVLGCVGECLLTGQACPRGLCIRGAISNRPRICGQCLKRVLAEHLLVSSRALDRSVFPDSADAKAVKGLIRTST